MRNFKIWFISVFTIAILGALAYSLYLSKRQIDDIANSMVTPISVLLLVLLWCFIILIVAGTLFSIVYGVIHLYRYFHKFEISEVGVHGNVIVRNNKHIVVNPYHHIEVKEVKEKAVKSIEEKSAIPTLKELLISGYITRLLANATMIFGFNQDTLEERLGDISDTRTLGVLGKSRSGKTVHMFFLILQYVLSGGIVYLVDRAFNKPSSLYKLLLPLIDAGYVKCAKKPMEIVELVEEFTSILDEREQNEDSDMSKASILIFDEWTSFARDKNMMKNLASIVHRIANESSGFNAYAMLGSQNIGASLSGGNALINSIHSWFTFKVDMLESKRILARRYATLTEKLKVGNNYFRDTSGEVEALITPLGTVEDSEIALAILQGTFNPISRISPYRNPTYYTPTFQSYNPKLLETPKPENNHAPIPTQHLKEQIAQHTTSYKLPTLPTLPLNNHAPSKPLIPDIVAENIRVTSYEQVQIQEAIDKAISEGKVKGNGKIIRTVLRDMLQWDNRQYEKVKIYCDVKGY